MKILTGSAAVLVISVLSLSAMAESEQPTLGDEAKQAIKDGAHEVGEKTRDTTTAIGHGSRDAAKAIGHGTRDAVHDVGNAAKSVWENLVAPRETNQK